MKILKLVNHSVILLSLIFLASCVDRIITDNITPIYKLYNPPIEKAEVFASGLVSSGLNDRDLTYSHKYKELFYAILEEPHFTIVSAKVNDDGSIAEPEIAYFSGQYDDCEPIFSPDGNRLYYCSTRPLQDGGNEKDYDIWYVDRTAEGWSDPVNIGAPVNTEKNEFYPSISNDQSLYFTSANMKIMRSKFIDGKYIEPELLSDSINSRVAEYNAYVAPDESFLIFTSHGWPGGMGQGDLYISYKKEDKTWTRAKNMGPRINSTGIEMCPNMGADHNFLFYASNRVENTNSQSPNKSISNIYQKAMHPDNGRMNIYWIDAKIIEDLKPDYLK